MHSWSDGLVADHHNDRVGVRDAQGRLQPLWFSPRDPPYSIALASPRPPCTGCQGPARLSARVSDPSP